MNNKYFTYPDKALWEDEAWADRGPVMMPLMAWIAEYNEQHLSAALATGKYDGRTDGEYNPKTGACTYSDIVDEWAARDMVYRCDEIGGAKWIALMPKELMSGENTDVPLIITLNAAPADCRNYAANVMEYRRDYNDYAAQNRAMVLHMAFHNPGAVALAGMVTQERAVDLNLSCKEIWLDLSALKDAGMAPEDVPGFVYRNEAGEPGKPVIQMLGDFPVLNIAGRFNSSVSFWITSSSNPHFHHKGFSLARLHDDACGEAAMRGIRLEKHFRKDRDPGFKEIWADMGLAYETFETKNQQWMALVPKAAMEPGAEELPVVCIFQETTKIYPFQNIMAVSLWYDYAKLSAQGECIVLMFALEKPDANDLWIDILHEAEEKFPIDKTRVYFTGHSHNGMFAAEFVRRHHEEITAVAPCGNHFGVPHPDYSAELVHVTDQQVNDMSTYDMPTVMVNGYGENSYFWAEEGSPAQANDVDAFHRRLKAERCPDRTDAEIRDARHSADRARRMLALPCDSTRIQFLYGRECYIGDILNNEGKDHFRIIALEDMVHMNAPQMPILCWDFMRRFRRNSETGAIEEL